MQRRESEARARRYVAYSSACALSMAPCGGSRGVAGVDAAAAQAPKDGKPTGASAAQPAAAAVAKKVETNKQKKDDAKRIARKYF
jgi:hypothetical protein